MSCKILDFGQRIATLAGWLSQQKQAEENHQYTLDPVSGALPNACCKARQAQTLLPFVAQAIQYRRGELRLKYDRLVAGLVLKRNAWETQAALAKVEADGHSA